jgi:hypothetical protein
LIVDTENSNCWDYLKGRRLWAKKMGIFYKRAESCGKREED